MPGLGATGGSKWQLSVGWRQSNANRSYFKEHVNHNFTHLWQPYERLSVLDVSASYRVNSRVSVIATLPVAMNRFSQLFPPLGDQNSETRRYGWSTAGLGDMTIFSQRWMLKPQDHPFENIALGVGMKLPTGNFNEQTLIPNLTGSGFMRRAAWPPAIMPGDGGTAVILGANAFKTFRSPTALRGHTVFATASYLVNPRNTNGTSSIVNSLGVPLAPQFLGEFTNSVTDSYNVQVGTSVKLPNTWDKPKLKGLRARLVYGWQGIPSKDLIGGSAGYRQAGYVMTVAPGFTYAYGKNLLIAEVPIVFNRYIDPNDSAVPGLPVMKAGKLVAAPFSNTRNLGMVAPASVMVRYVRSF